MIGTERFGSSFYQIPIPCVRSRRMGALHANWRGSQSVNLKVNFVFKIEKSRNSFLRGERQTGN